MPAETCIRRRPTGRFRANDTIGAHESAAGRDRECPAPLYSYYGLAPAAHAVDAIVLEVGELRVAGIPVEAASARLDLLSDKQTRVTLKARAATLPDPVGKLTTSRCVHAPVIAEPRFGCDAGRLTGRGGPTGSIDAAMTAEMNTDTGVTHVRRQRAESGGNDGDIRRAPR